MTTFRQTASGNEIFLDHIAHWVPDMEAAADALENLGFTLTPYTEHTNSTAPGEPIVPAGSANQCIMLREGYLEILTPTADTAVGREVSAGIDRYVGVHLAAFGCADSPAQRERLIGEGFDQRPVVDLRREVDDENGETGTLQFTVIRPVPGTMAEGRIQFLTHHTPDLLWQERWMGHPNGAERLTELFICVEDTGEAVGRYERYLDRKPEKIGNGWLINVERGRVALLTPGMLTELVADFAIPGLPYIAGYTLQCNDLSNTIKYLQSRGILYRELTNDVVAVVCPPALGGILLFTSKGYALPWGQ